MGTTPSTNTADAQLVGTWAVGAQLGECPQWLPGCKALLWVDVLGPSVNRLDPSTGISTPSALPAKIGSAAAGADGAMLLALASGLWRLAPGGVLQPCASPDMAAILFNDGKCDAAGRFWVGSRSNDGTPGKGCLYRLDADGTLSEQARGFDVCNGMGWSLDATSFYLVDTVPRLLYRFDFDLATGTLSGQRVIQDFAAMPGKPDGLAVDRDGNIWCAMWDGGGIQILSADGAPVGWLETFCPRPTSCAFGGDDLRTLFVTSASFGLDPGDPERFGLSGQILAFRTAIPGTPVAGYRLPLSAPPVPNTHGGDGRRLQAGG